MEHNHQHSDELVSEEEHEDDMEEIEASDQPPQLFDATQHAPQLHYQLKTENGQVTYRVVQVQQQQQDNSNSGGNVSSNATHALVSHAPSLSNVSTAQSAVAQAIIAHGNPFVSGASSASVVSNDGSGGPFYVMMAPSQELVSAASTQRNVREVVPRVARDERRATHNEVERRRRDKINSWIIKLAKVVPDCAQDHTKQGQSKGGILAKATEYIQELSMENSRMQEIVKENELLNNELDAVRSQFVDAKNENRRLRSLLARSGVTLPPNISGSEES